MAAQNAGQCSACAAKVRDAERAAAAKDDPIELHAKIEKLEAELLTVYRERDGATARVKQLEASLDSAGIEREHRDCEECEAYGACAQTKRVSELEGENAALRESIHIAETDAQELQRKLDAVRTVRHRAYRDPLWDRIFSELVIEVSRYRGGVLMESTAQSNAELAAKLTQTVYEEAVKVRDAQCF
jgi:chromosome segregation ATPase